MDTFIPRYRYKFKKGLDIDLSTSLCIATGAYTF